MMDILETYSYKNSLLPLRIRELLEKHRSEVDNYAFRLERAACFKEKEGRIKPELYTSETKRDPADGLRKLFELRHVLETDRGDFFTSLAMRQKTSLKALCPQHLIYEGDLETGFITGLGNSSVFEVGMTLNHTHGFPYIPGTGFKGAVRSYVIESFFDQNEETALEDEGFRQVFGDTDVKGGIIFPDALPITPPEIEEDITNSHYQDYYQGNEPPADWLSPNPVFFHTVVNTRFQFILGLRPGANPMCLSLAEQWFLDCAQEHGFGAKTMVGYGYFKNLHRL